LRYEPPFEAALRFMRGGITPSHRVGKMEYILSGCSPPGKTSICQTSEHLLILDSFYYQSKIFSDILECSSYSHCSVLIHGHSFLAHKKMGILLPSYYRLTYIC
jgi:hypothetical protein